MTRPGDSATDAARGRIAYVRREGSTIFLYVRAENKQQVKLEVSGFRPHFYVKNPRGSFVDFRGVRLERVYASLPDDVPGMRRLYNEHWQADIPFTRLFLIENNIYSYIRFPRNRDKVSFREITPDESGEPIEPRLLYIDIEVKLGVTSLEPEKAEEEIISITAYDSYFGKYITLVVDETLSPMKQENADNWIAFTFTNEQDLLFNFVRLLNKISPDYVVGWNVEYDTAYLRSRCGKYKFPVEFPDEIDLLKLYRRAVSQPSYSLGDVASYEGYGKTHCSVDEFSKLRGLELARYNMTHVKLLVELDAKYLLSRDAMTSQELAGMAHIYDDYPSQLIDSLLLRIANRRKVILPSKNEEEHLEHYDKYEGALITEPTQGIFRNVANIDISRCYPSVIMTFNISPETLTLKPTGDDNIAGDYGFKRQPKGIIPELVEIIWEARDRMERRMQETTPGTREYEILKSKRNVYKGLLNAVYGFLSYPGSRVFDTRLASAVAMIARKILSFLIDYFNAVGYKVLYADTDGLFLCISFEETTRIIKEAESALAVFLKEKFNVDSRMKLKLDKYASTILFTKVKKKYAMRVVWEGGKECDYVSITGFEAIRRDVPQYLRSVVSNILEKILKDEPREKILEYLKNSLEDFKNQPLESVCMTKRLAKRLDDYKVLAPHIRGVRYAMRNLGETFTEGDRVKLLWVKGVKGLPPTDVVAFNDFKNVEGKIIVDYDRIVETTISSVLDEILAPLGLERKGVGKAAALERWLS